MNPEHVFPKEAERLRRSLPRWAEAGRLPPERSAQLADLARRTMATPGTTSRSSHPRQSHPPRWRVTAAATAVAVAVLVGMASLIPRGGAWAEAATDWLSRYVNLHARSDPGWAWARQHTAFQEVLAADRDQDYTFRVHRVLADPTQTIVIYSLAGPEPLAGDAVPALAKVEFNGRPLTTPRVLRSGVIDGVQVGHLELRPLPAAEGTLRITLDHIGAVAGRWQVSFPVTRVPLAQWARTIPVEKTLDLPGVPLQVTEVRLTPTATTISVRYSGAGPPPELGHGPSGAVRLLTAAGDEVPYQGSSRETRQDEKQAPVHFWQLRFGPVPAGTERVTLRVEGLARPVPGSRLVLALTPGAAATAGGQPAVQVAGVQENRAVLQWQQPVEMPYRDWWVLDQHGDAYRAQAGWEVVSGVTRRTVRWNGAWAPLPPDRRAVRLEAREVWEQVSGAWEVAISLESPGRSRSS